jgi:HEAT repeat protein
MLPVKTSVLVALLAVTTPALAQQAPPPAAPRASYDQVVANLKSPEADVRRDALRALGATAYPEAIAPLSQLLTDPVDDIQLETIYTLLSFYHVEKPEVVDREKGLRVRPTSRLTAAAQRIYDLGPYGLIPQPVPVELTNGLAQSMFDDNPRVRLESVYALGVMARPPLDGYAAEALPRLLKDSVEDIREAAARVIGGLRVATAGDALVEALNDKSTPVATASMRALGDIKAWQSIQALTDQFTYYKGKGPRAEAAFDALARIAHASSQPLFLEHLSSKQPNLRRLSAEGLARSGNREAAQ